MTGTQTPNLPSRDHCIQPDYRRLSSRRRSVGRAGASQHSWLISRSWCIRARRNSAPWNICAAATPVDDVIFVPDMALAVALTFVLQDLPSLHEDCEVAQVLFLGLGSCTLSCWLEHYFVEKKDWRIQRLSTYTCDDLTPAGSASLKTSTRGVLWLSLSISRP
jgi:hypothetical protein